MAFGDIHIWLWALLFVSTLFYEYLTVRCTISIIKLQSLAVANFSVALNAIGMGCVVLYTNELNNSIPILTAVWLGNYYAVELEKRKRAKEDSSIKNDSK